MSAVQDVLETGRVIHPAGFTSIVVALDLEANGDRALPVARGLAKLGGIPVELLTVSSPHVAEDVDVFELTRDGERLATQLLLTRRWPLTQTRPDRDRPSVQRAQRMQLMQLTEERCRPTKLTSGSNVRGHWDLPTSGHE